MNRPNTKQPKSACAREIAWKVLCKYEDTSTFAADLLDEQFRTTLAEPVVRRLATQITLGTIRRKLTLDIILRIHISRPQEKVEPELWNLLRVGAFQVVFMATAPHAAVNETVNVTHRNQKSHWSKLLNGVLRSILRSLTDETTGRPARNTIPIEHGSYRIYDRPIFPDPAEQSATFLAQAFSFPEWLIDRWLQNQNAIELVRQLFWFNSPPPLTLRINRLRNDRAQYQQALTEQGITSRPGRIESALTIVGQHPPIHEFPGYHEGWFCVQDEVAMSAALLLDPKPGEIILDLCAAPGTKTTHLAELMEDKGKVVATDVDQTRLDRIQDNASRLRLTCIEPRLIERDGTDIPPGPFDAILVDVPCTNTGVLSRRPEARWRLTTDDFDELGRIQTRLLTAACQRVVPGGRVVYSTCSIDPSENQSIVRNVCQQLSKVTIQKELTHTPGQPADGAYQSLLIVE